MKHRLTFYTNIPSPYNLDLFEALSNHFNLTVVYYSKLENGRQWEIDTNHPKYCSKVLENNFIGRFIQKFKSEFHFSSGILKLAINDDSATIILGGNYFSPNTYIVLLVSKIKGKKIFWFGEKLLPTTSLIKSKIKSILLLPLFNSCFGILCVGQAAIKSYQNFGYKGLCHNIPYSINSSKFNINALNQIKLDEYKAKLNPDNKLIILTSGSLIHRKGIDIAIKVYLDLPLEIKCKTLLWIIGNGPLKSELETMVEKNEEITFFGFIDTKELPYFFNLSSIFLFCSRYDGWAVVINEALSAGLPVVVSDQVVAAEIIENEINGFVCESENVTLFTNAVQKILHDYPMRTRMKKNNYYKSGVIDSFSTAKKIQKILLDE